MDIRPGWQSPAPEPVEDTAGEIERTQVKLIFASEMTLPQPNLSVDCVDQTRMLFREFLAHLDRLGLCEPATHVSLGFERFLAMYPVEGDI
jgi:hypothetical protein